MIIPAIIAKNKDELVQKLHTVESFPNCRLVHIDIMDGKFVSNKTISYKTLKETCPSIPFELHLMVEQPEQHISDWIGTKPRRIILHHESTKRLPSLFPLFKKAKMEASIALNPETPVTVLKSLQPIKRLLLMSVNPGSYGAKFLPLIYKKIRNARRIFPRIRIAIDGGVSLENIGKLQKSGASDFCIGSRVFQTENRKMAFVQFKKKLVSESLTSTSIS
jgi:ribulose-phosphate 3-epimerase